MTWHGIMAWDQLKTRRTFYGGMKDNRSDGNGVHTWRLFCRVRAKAVCLSLLHHAKTHTDRRLLSLNTGSTHVPVTLFSAPHSYKEYSSGLQRFNINSNARMQ